MDQLNESSLPVGTEPPAPSAPAAGTTTQTTRTFPSDGVKTKSRQRHLFLLAEENLTVAQFSVGKNGIEVQRVAKSSADMTSLRSSGGDVIKAIDIVLQELPERPKTVDVVLPEDAVKKSVISLPDVSVRKARKILRNRALQVSGLPEEELLWSVRPLGSVKTGEKSISNWLVLTISRPALLRYVDVFRSAGIKVTGFYPATSLLLNLSAPRPGHTEVLAEVILGANLVLFSILAGESIAFTRSIRFDPAEVGERHTILAGELRRSFLYCQQNLTDAVPDRVEILHAGNTPIEPFTSMIQAQTGVTSQAADLRTWIKHGDASDPSALDEDAHLLLLGAGLMFTDRKQAEKANILPKDLRPRNWGVSAKIATTLALIEIGLLLFRISGNLEKDIEQKRKILAAHQESKRALVPTLNALDEVEKRDQFIEVIEQRSDELVPIEYDWVSVFKDLAFLPESEIRFNDVRVRNSSRERYVSEDGGKSSNDWSVRVEVSSPLPYRQAQEVVQQYVQNLRRSRYFETVNVKPSSGSNDSRKDTVLASSTFSIECQLR